MMFVSSMQIQEETYLEIAESVAVDNLLNAVLSECIYLFKTSVI